MERPDDEVAVAVIAPSSNSSSSVADAVYAWDMLDDDDQMPGDDTSRAPEEENHSRIPGDPRDPNEQQPPFKEQY